MQGLGAVIDPAGLERHLRQIRAIGRNAAHAVDDGDGLLDGIDAVGTEVVQEACVKGVVVGGGSPAVLLADVLGSADVAANVVSDFGDLKGFVDGPHEGEGGGGGEAEGEQQQNSKHQTPSTREITSSKTQWPLPGRGASLNESGHRFYFAFHVIVEHSRTIR